MGRGHLSEQELQSLALAGTLRQDVQVHTTAVDQLCAHACLAQSVLQPGDDPLGLVPLHSHVVAQLVGPLLALCLHPTETLLRSAVFQVQFRRMQRAAI